MIGEKIANLPKGVRADRCRTFDTYTQKEAAEILGTTREAFTQARAIRADRCPTSDIYRSFLVVDDDRLAVAQELVHASILFH
jgi:hypothetical protein